MLTSQVFQIISSPSFRGLLHLARSHIYISDISQHEYRERDLFIQSASAKFRCITFGHIKMNLQVVRFERITVRNALPRPEGSLITRTWMDEPRHRDERYLLLLITPKHDLSRPRANICLLFHNFLCSRQHDWANKGLSPPPPPTSPFCVILLSGDEKRLMRKGDTVTGFKLTSVSYLNSNQMKTDARVRGA